MGGKQVALIGGQMSCPYWGTNGLPLLGDKWVALIGGQTSCPYWGTNELPLLGDKQFALIGGQMGCPFWGTNEMPLLGDKQVKDQNGIQYITGLCHFQKRGIGNCSALHYFLQIVEC